MNEKRLRVTVFIIAAVLHLVIVFFFVIDLERFNQQDTSEIRVMKLTDLAELPPPAPPEQEITQEEAQPVEPDNDSLNDTAANILVEDEYLPMHLLSTPPIFDQNTIAADLIYPYMARMSGIEGRVILEISVDRTGTVQKVIVFREEPEGMGFGESAIRAFTGKKGIPATLNGQNVSSLIRYPLNFILR